MRLLSRKRDGHGPGRRGHHGDRGRGRSGGRGRSRDGSGGGEVNRRGNGIVPSRGRVLDHGRSLRQRQRHRSPSGMGASADDVADIKAGATSLDRFSPVASAMCHARRGWLLIL